MPQASAKLKSLLFATSIHGEFPLRSHSRVLYPLVLQSNRRFGFSASAKKGFPRGVLRFRLHEYQEGLIPSGITDDSFLVYMYVYLSRFVFFGGWCVFIPGQSASAGSGKRCERVRCTSVSAPYLQLINLLFRGRFAVQKCRASRHDSL